MRPPKVLVVQPFDREAMSVLECQAKVVVARNALPETVAEEGCDAEAIIVRTNPLPGWVLRACEKLVVVGRHGVGIDNIDVETATELGIVVVNTPGTNTVSVAEHAIALILCCAKRIVWADKLLRESERFTVREELLATELEGKILGIVGAGRTGQAVGVKCKAAFGTRVICYDPFVDAERVARLGFSVVPALEDLLAESDVVSLHVPLTAQTQRLLGDREFSLMKRGVILVNCARGGVVDERALLRALETGIVAAAGLDVFDPEPPRPDNPLFRFPNVVVTPHMAGLTKESARRMGMVVVEQVLKVLRGEMPEHLVNPEVWGRRRLMHSRFPRRGG